MPSATTAKFTDLHAAEAERRTQTAEREVARDAPQESAPAYARPIEERVSVLETHWEDVGSKTVTINDLKGLRASFTGWAVVTIATMLIAFVTMFLMQQSGISSTRSELQGNLNAVIAELKADNRSINTRIDRVEQRLERLEEKMDARFEKMETRFEKIDSQFKEIDARFNEQDAKFEKIDARFDEIDARFREQDVKLDAIMAAIREQRQDSR